ncbi:MAG: class I SAM-dependent methyltransferase [Candidatus Acidiferrum sp.]
MGDRTRARQLAAEYVGKGDPTGWFEVLYKEAEEGKSIVPWADHGVNSGLIEFWRENPQATDAKKALVIASGLGDDAEQLSAWGFETTAFDVSETAIRTARKRFPESKVKFRVADLFHPPAEWERGFDFVFEANTVQALPVRMRSEAIRRIAALVRPGGKLLAIVRGRELDEPEGELPWPLTRAQMNEFVRAGLTEESLEEYFDNEVPPARRFRGLYKRL